MGNVNPDSIVAMAGLLARSPEEPPAIYRLIDAPKEMNRPPMKDFKINSTHDKFAFALDAFLKRMSTSRGVEPLMLSILTAAMKSRETSKGTFESVFIKLINVKRNMYRK